MIDTFRPMFWPKFESAKDARDSVTIGAFAALAAAVMELISLALAWPHIAPINNAFAPMVLISPAIYLGLALAIYKRGLVGSICAIVFSVAQVVLLALIFRKPHDMVHFIALLSFVHSFRGALALRRIGPQRADT